MADIYLLYSTLTYLSCHRKENKQQERGRHRVHARRTPPVPSFCGLLVLLSLVFPLTPSAPLERRPGRALHLKYGNKQHTSKKASTMPTLLLLAAAVIPLAATLAGCTVENFGGKQSNDRTFRH